MLGRIGGAYLSSYWAINSGLLSQTLSTTVTSTSASSPAVTVGSPPYADSLTITSTGQVDGPQPYLLSFNYGNPWL
jgi:hypothetical protein